jgi:hypothetical protein
MQVRVAVLGTHGPAAQRSGIALLEALVSCRYDVLNLVLCLHFTDLPPVSSLECSSFTRCVTVVRVVCWVSYASVIALCLFSFHFENYVLNIFDFCPSEWTWQTTYSCAVTVVGMELL